MERRTSRKRLLPTFTNNPHRHSLAQVFDRSPVQNPRSIRRKLDIVGPEIPDAGQGPHQADKEVAQPIEGTISNESDQDCSVQDDEVFPLETCHLPNDEVPVPSSDEDRTVVDVRCLYKKMDQAMSWEKLLSFVLVAGSPKFSATQYEIVASAFRSLSANVHLYSYKTVRSKMCTSMGDLGGVPTRLVGVPNKYSDDVVQVRVVLPSDWARLDVSSYPFYTDVYQNPNQQYPGFVSIENAPIVHDRSSYGGRTINIWAAYDACVIPCIMGDVLRYSTATLPKGVHELNWDIKSDPTRRDGSSASLVDVTLLACWCVHNECSTTQQVPHDVHEFSQAERAVYEYYRFSDKCATTIARPSASGRWMERKLTSRSDSSHVVTYPGDICAIFRNQSRTCAVLGDPVARLGCSLVPERLLWIRVSSMASTPVFTVVTFANVTKLPQWISGTRANPHMHDNGHRNIGILDSGERFALYRIALYADGFKQHKSLSNKKSVNGMYMMPLGLSLSCRRSTSCVRVLTIAPHGTSALDAMSIFVEDIVKGTTEGVQGVDPFGRHLRIFIDLVGFFGDFPVSAEMCDSLGHIADACCNMCCMRKRKQGPEPPIMYTTDINSRRPGYMRCDERVHALRESVQIGELARKLGIRYQSNAAASEHPFIRLSKLLRQENKVHKVEGMNVVNTWFDSSFCCAAVPDHLLTGLMKDVLHLCFVSLSSDERRRDVEQLTLDSISVNSLPVSGRLLKWEGTRCKGLQSLSMTDLFCVLFCSCQAFASECSRTGNRLYNLPLLLQRFVSSVYYSESTLQDPVGDEPKTHQSVMHKYLNDAAVLGKNYVKEAKWVYMNCGSAAAVLDKPNIHRLLELCVSTLPAFGHALLCSELVLELKHRTFKTWLESNPHSNAHLTCVERAVSLDWLGRLNVLYKVWKDGNVQDRSCAERGLRRMFLGNNTFHLDAGDPSTCTFMNAFRSRIEQTFRDPIPMQLEDISHVMVPWLVDMAWCTLPREKVAMNSDEVDLLVQVMDSTHGENGRYSLSFLTLFSCARFVSTSRSGLKSNCYPHNVVRHGTVVRIRKTCTLGKVMERYIAVVLILTIRDNTVWGVGMEMVRRGNVHSCKYGTPEMFRFDEHVRRVAVFHVCDQDCVIDVQSRSVRHSSGVLSGGLYKLMGKKDGYPPHMG